MAGFLLPRRLIRHPLCIVYRTALRRSPFFFFGRPGRDPWKTQPSVSCRQWAEVAFRHRTNGNGVSGRPLVNLFFRSP